MRSGALAIAGALTAGPAILDAQRRVPLADRYSDLRRHFFFEYYPWYRTDPWEHWPEGGHHPPADLGSNFVPALGLYDSRSTAVMEQHARWIANAGVGAIDVSWWGPDSNVNEIIPTLMDVMGAHDVHVAFYIEPYTDAHAQNYARDVLSLIKTYGDRRHWDYFLLHEYEDGTVGPAFKSFRTILPATGTDCHGVTTPVGDYAADALWRRQTDAVRETLKGDFDRVTLLADSLAVDRTQASGFDGIALFDNYVSIDRWRQAAADCSSRGLVFSFQINPGFDSIVFPQSDPNACYKPPAFAPGGGTYDWTRVQDREAAAQASRSRIVESFEATVGLQTSPSLSDAKQGFFLAYINSFNEWHEGHQFEPAKDSRDLTDAERAAGYHDPENGRYRLDELRDLIRSIS